MSERHSHTAVLVQLAGALAGAGAMTDRHLVEGGGVILETIRTADSIDNVLYIIRFYGRTTQAASLFARLEYYGKSVRA